MSHQDYTIAICKWLGLNDNDIRKDDNLLLANYPFCLNSEIERINFETK